MSFLSPSPPARPPPPARTASSSSAQSHQTGIIKEHWNDLPNDFTPSTSRNVSRTGTPLSRNGYGPLVAGDGSGDSPDFDNLISSLFSAPTSLSANEAKLLASKVQKNVASITPEQKNSVGYIIQAVAIDRGESPAWGRQQVVDLMMREKGVSGWAIAIRKLVESVL
ncbi:hypothetical protein EV426DRAFT_82302 [Tirmania nivea]|nr:hypothetical protein EV426DRAFT_82302 [Tirmania nivea]